jgi:hypothetical protein
MFSKNDTNSLCRSNDLVLIWNGGYILFIYFWKRERDPKSALSAFPYILFPKIKQAHSVYIHISFSPRFSKADKTPTARFIICDLHEN